MGKMFITENMSTPKLRMMFPIHKFVYLPEHYTAGAETYLNFVFEVAGKESFKYFLKKKDMIVNLNFEVRSNEAGSVVYIQIELTDYGDKNKDTVLSYVFSFLHKL